MLEGTEFVPVFRSADQTASTQANKVFDLLTEAGIDAQIYDDNAPDVPAGVYEVRVPAAQSDEAERLIAETHGGDDLPTVNTSRELDMVPVFISNKNDAEMECMAIEGLLKTSGIDSMIVASSPLPSLAAEVRVPRQQLDEARRIIDEAQRTGPSDAEAAEAESEQQGFQAPPE
jgi:hypothetical protein